MFLGRNPLSTLTAWLDGISGNIHWADENGQTLLHYAVRNFDVEIATLLLARGIDAKTKDRNGSTALDVAEASGSSAAAGVVDLLSQQAR
jgi:ankyrin repeat protein